MRSSAARSSPSTVRSPGCAAQPANSVPSYCSSSLTVVMRSIFPEEPSSEEVMRRLLLLVGLLVAATVGCMGDEEAAPTATEQTETAVTAERLTDAVTREGLRAHLEALQRIADEHDGNRSSGTPGYDASVEYVVATLQEAGYEPS